MDSGTMRWEERRQKEMGLYACLLYPLLICCSFLIDSVGLTTGRTDEGGGAMCSQPRPRPLPVLFRANVQQERS